MSSKRRPADKLARVEVRSRDQWRSWLQANHEQRASIWLVSYKKHRAGLHVPYDDIVEEALCFGWIDSVRRRLDDERTMLLLAPRKSGSSWSRINKGRVRSLQRRRQMAPAGLRKIEKAREDGSWTMSDDVENLVIPADLARSLDANPRARVFFDTFPPSAVKPILWWIKSAKRASTREKRIAETVRLASVNRRANQG